MCSYSRASLTEHNSCWLPVNITPTIQPHPKLQCVWEASCCVVNSCSRCSVGVVQTCTRKRMQPKVLTRVLSLCQQRQVHLVLPGCALTIIYRLPSSTSASRAARQTQQVPAQLYAHGHLPLYIAGCSSSRGSSALSWRSVLALCIWHLHLRRTPAMTAPALYLLRWHTFWWQAC